MNNFRTFNLTNSGMQTGSVAKNFVSAVFLWMGIALMITAFTAYYFASNAKLIQLLIHPESGMTILGWVVAFAPLGFVLVMGMGFQRFSSSVLTLLFGAFSILMGMSLSFIFLVYTSSSIYLTFAITSGLFLFMAVLGYTTKTDLTRLGSFLMMALVGIIIASVANFFFHSARLDYVISIIGVIVFTGLTAYDVQKLKRIGSGVEFGSESSNKLIIMGAMTLYLDFINLFLFLLRFLGRRD